jgi:DNA-binding transcriptional LysR family regulator
MASIDLNLLALFSIVAETSSFSDAARKLRVPRSSVSRQVGELETALGVQLFNRTTRKVALSSAGEALHQRVAPQLAALNQAVGSLPERDEIPSGELRLTAAPDFGVTVLAEILAGFSLRYPAISVDVRLSSRLVDLVAEGFDVALRIKGRGRLADSSLVARRLTTLDMGLYAAPAYVARARPIRSVDDTADADWVGFSRAGDLPAPFPKPARRPRLGGDEMLFVYEAVRAGAGIALLPSFLTGDDLAAGRLVRLLPRIAVEAGALYFVHPAGAKLAKKVVAFRDHVLEYIATHPLCPGSA